MVPWLKSTFSAQQSRRWKSGYIFIRLAAVASPKCKVSQNSEKFELIAVQGHQRSMILVPVEQRICGFLLVISSNFGPILHRSWDTATYWLKIAYFSYPSHSAPRSLCSVWNFAVKLTTRKLEWWGYLWWKLTDPTVWQTDWQTDERAIAYCALLHIMPSRAKKICYFLQLSDPMGHKQLDELDKQIGV